MTINKSIYNNGPYIKFIAYLQVIGIIIVVFGHSFYKYPDGDCGHTLLIYKLCYNFRMPLFMFVSGFLMMYTEFMGQKNPSIKRFGITKIKRLILPYMVLTLLTYYPRAAMSSIADNTRPMSFTAMIESLYITELLPIPFFWFIQSSFLLLISTYVIFSLTRFFKLPDLFVISVLIIVSICLGSVSMGSVEYFSYKKALYYSVFFVGGIAYCRYYSLITRYLQTGTWPFFCLMVVMWYVSYMVFKNTEYEKIASFFGIFMCISFTQLLTIHHVTFIDHLQGANYMIFLLSWYFNVLSQQVLSHFVDLPCQIYTILSLIFGIYIPWLGYIYLKSNQHKKYIRHISFLLGQSFRK